MPGPTSKYGKKSVCPPKIGTPGIFILGGGRLSNGHLILAQMWRRARIDPAPDFNARFLSKAPHSHRLIGHSRAPAHLRVELHEIMQTDHLVNARLLVLANKQDLPSAMSCDEMVDKLSLQTLDARKWFVSAMNPRVSNTRTIRTSLGFARPNTVFPIRAHPNRMCCIFACCQRLQMKRIRLFFVVVFFWLIFDALISQNLHIKIFCSLRVSFSFLGFMSRFCKKTSADQAIFQIMPCSVNVSWWSGDSAWAHNRHMFFWAPKRLQVILSLSVDFCVFVSWYFVLLFQTNFTKNFMFPEFFWHQSNGEIIRA